MKKILKNSRYVEKTTAKMATSSKTVHSKLETLMFSGKDEDFEDFAERFEARLHLLKLSKLRSVLLDTETLPATEAENCADESEKLKEKQFEVWCEMVQCLDKKTLSLIKCLKPNGTAAWRELQNCFKSKGRPRIHQLLNKLTNLKLVSSERIRDYLVRAEELELNLSEVNENVSDQMLCSVVLKGLPQQFAKFVTVFKFSHELKFFLDLKRDLLNFDSESNLKGTDEGSSSHFSKDVKCFKCGKFGHKQAQCRSKTVAIVCYECGEEGHKANACPKAQKKPLDKRNKKTQKRFFTKRNEGILTTELNDTDGFSFTRPINEKTTLTSNFW